MIHSPRHLMLIIINYMYKKQFAILKEKLGVKNAVSIRFSGVKTAEFKKFKDTACTALARSLKNNVLTYIDRRTGQLCSGGDYFLGISKIPKNKLCDVYVRDEKIFKNNSTCLSFLNKLPKYHALTKKRYVLFTPLAKEKNKPDVVEFLATPAQASRILGLSVYKNMSYPVITPALSTCASILAPIASGGVHLNFIDYFDRYHQCVRSGRPFFKDAEMLISLPYSLFNDIIECVGKSPHGLFKPNLKPTKITKL